MRTMWMVLVSAYVGVALFGCAEEEQKNDKVRVKAPFVDVRVKDDGSTEVKAPGTHVKTHD